MDIKLTNKVHAIILSISITICIALAFIVNVINKTEIVYTHLFYIPILMAGIWYKRKALYVAGILGVVHIGFDFFSSHNFTISSFLRTAIFFVVAIVVGFLSEQKVNFYQEFIRLNKEEAENEEREVRERFELFFSSSPIITWISRLSDGRYEAINQSFTSTFGYTAEEAMGKTSAELKIFTNYQDRKRMLFETSEKGYFNNLELKLQKKSGEYFIGLTSAKRIQMKGDLYLIGTVIDITDKKLLEEEYTMIVKTTMDAFWLHDMEGRFLQVNDALCNLIGYSKNELVNMHVYDVAYNRTRETVLEHIEAIKNIKQERFEVPYRCKNGKIIIAEVSATYLPLSNCICIFLRDITEKIQAEKALKISEEKHRVLFENAAEMIIVVKDGQIKICNPASEKITGYTIHELLSMPTVVNIVHSEDLTTIIENHEKLLKCEAFEGIKIFRLVKKDGTLRWVEMHSVKIKWENEDATLNFIMDITDRKATEEMLEKSEEQFRLLVSQMHQGLAVHEIICDENGTPIDYRFLSVNKSFEELTGLKGENIIGKTILEVLPNTESYWIDIYGKVALTGEPHQFENYSGKLGKYYSVSAYSPKKNQFAVILNDITEKKKTEEKIISLSYHDLLTGLYNRRFYEEELQKLNSDEKYLPLTIIMADVNGLKLTNDVFGHEAGDTLLVAISKILKSVCREKDVIARVGGDEFVILLPKSDSVNSKRVINRIEAAISNEKTENVALSISMGYATKYDMLTNINEVYKGAEDYMYRNKLFESVQMKRKTIQYILETLYNKNNREMLHYESVSRISRLIATELNLDREKIEKIEMAGFMHDIGKIGIDFSTLDKSGKLDPEKWGEFKRHSEIGYRILSSVDEYSEIAKYVLEHHERFNGEGYPKGLKGEEISLQARIIALADAFDTMTTERTYAKILSYDEAAEEIKANAGTQFDPYIAEIFVQKVLNKICVK